MTVLIIFTIIYGLSTFITCAYLLSTDINVEIGLVFTILPIINTIIAIKALTTELSQINIKNK